MPIDFSRTNQVEQLENTAKEFIYRKVEEKSKNGGFIRLSGLPLGLTCSLMTVAKRIGSIAECVFKSLCNIFGSIFCIPQCEFGRGLGQAGDAVINVVILPFSVASAIWELVRTSVMIAIDPADYAKEKHEQHKTHLENLKQTVEVNANLRIVENESADKNSAEYVRTSLALAYAYESGKGVAADLRLAAHHFLEGKNYNEAVRIASALEYSPEPKDMKVAATTVILAASQDHPLALRKYSEDKYQIAFESLKDNFAITFIKCAIDFKINIVNEDYIEAANICRRMIPEFEKNKTDPHLLPYYLRIINNKIPGQKKTDDEEMLKPYNNPAMISTATENLKNFESKQSVATV